MCTTQGRNEDENPKETRNSVPETRGTEEETPEYCPSLCLKDQRWRHCLRSRRCPGRHLKETVKAESDLARGKSAMYQNAPSTKCENTRYRCLAGKEEPQTGF